MSVVSNTGPFIALARIGRLELLPRLFGEVLIPAAVWREISEGGAGRPGSDEAASASWLRVAEVQDALAVDLLNERLDAGESEAIVLALEHRATLLLIDESRGRRLAVSRGVRVSGVLGILLAAKRQAFLAAVAPALSDLEAVGFRMSEALKESVLADAGELH